MTHERLGRGGNATVWRATRPGEEQPLAVKVINATKVDREPYQRFVREIRFLREYQDVPGLLPLIDAYLPEDPRRSDQPWLAMPIATPITAALENASLDDVVSALAEIAQTLLRLQQGFDIAHRDIKPGNLYELDGQWLIGDFGLVAIPDAESLTGEGKQVGPAHFTAYEMIIDAAHADPHPADVYSLGKTLWVLATGQTFPPEGHQPVGMRGFGIGDYRPHARARVLDQAVDLMTRLRPEERPNKERVARDLSVWHELEREPVAFDVSQARARLRTKLQSEIAQQDTFEQYRDLAHAAVRRLQELTTPLNAGLKELYDRTTVDSATDEMTQNILKTHFSQFGQDVEFRWQRCTVVVPSEHPGGTCLKMMRCLELFTDGTLVLHLMIFVGPQGVMGQDYSWQLPAASAPVGSVEAEKMLEDGIRQMTEALTRGVDVFVEKVPDLGPG
jgi:serine/threonine protein kinase